MVETSVTPSARSPRPVDAAALILLDRSMGEPRILMGRRHDRHSFMPNLQAFPGGRVDPPDARAWAHATFKRRDQALLMRHVTRPTRRRAHALGVAAIRETLEETGLAVGRRGGMDAAQAEAWPFHAQAGLVPALDRLRFVARAITPPGFPKRYDCRFLLTDLTRVRAIAAAPPSGELEDVRWVALSDLAAARLPEITARVLAELDPVLRGADPPRRVPFFKRRGKTDVKALIEAP